MTTDDILAKAVNGTRLTPAEGVELFRCCDLHKLGRAAHAVAMRLHPEPYRTFNIDRNVNYTNVCAAVCDFCAFYRKSNDAWYVEIQGRQVRLAKGKANRAEAVKQFHLLMAGARPASPPTAHAGLNCPVPYPNCGLNDTPSSFWTNACLAPCWVSPEAAVLLYHTSKVSLSKNPWSVRVYRALYASVSAWLMSKYRPGNSRLFWITRSPLNSKLLCGDRSTPRAKLMLLDR